MTIELKLGHALRTHKDEALERETKSTMRALRWRSLRKNKSQDI